MTATPMYVLAYRLVYYIFQMFHSLLIELQVQHLPPTGHGFNRADERGEFC